MVFKIYLIFCLLSFILIELCIYDGIHKIKIKYADKIRENRNKADRNIFGFLYAHLKIFIFCFIPLINLCVFFSVLFEGVQVQEETMKRVDKAIKESEK